jgi:hypothetical protein
MKDIKELSPLHWAGIVVVLAVVVGFLGYRSLAAPSHPPIPDMKQAYQSIDDMARKTQGDFSKLAPSEQNDLNSFAKGHGKQYLLARYKILTTGSNK